MRRLLAALASIALLASPAGAANLTPDQLTAAVTVNNTDLMLIYPTGGPMKSAQWSVVKGLMQSALGTVYLQVANNLNDLASPSSARTNLGLGTAALINTGTTGGVIGLLNGTNSWSAEQFFQPSTVAGASINLFPGTAPTSPMNGDMWMTSAGLFGEVSGAPVQFGAALGYTPVNRAGDTMTGLLTLGAGVDLSNTVASGQRVLEYATSGSVRWQVLANSGAETGSNVGSDLDICRFSDAAALLDCPLAIFRSNGLVVVQDGLGVTGDSSVTGVGSGTAFAIADTANANGAMIILEGNGSTTPNKYLRADGGKFDIVSSSFSQNILDLTDAGVLTVAGNFAGPLTGNVTGNLAGNVTGNVSGNSGTASALAFGRTIAITGDLTYTSPSFDGSGNVTAAGTLAAIVAGGTCTNATVTIDTKGRTTNCTSGAAPVTSFNGRGGAVSPTTGDYAVAQVTGAAPLASPTFTGSPTVSGTALVLTTDTRFGGPTQNSQSTAYGFVLTDIGGQVYHPSADTTPRTWTIPANASVAVQIGGKIDVVNDCSAGALTIPITSDTLVWFPAGTTGTRTLAACGEATLTKVGATRWIITGVGLSFLMLVPAYRRRPANDNDDQQEEAA